MLKTQTKIYLPLALLMLLIIAIFGAMTYHQINIGDYPDHIEITKQINEETFSPRLAHTLFAKLVIFVRSNLPFNWVYKINQPFGLAAAHNSYEIATVVLITFVYAFTGYIIWKRALGVLKEKEISSAGVLSGLITLVVMLVAPITVITFPHQQYIGYFAPNPFHNPTYTLLRPFALLWFFIIIDKAFSKPDTKYLVYSALLAFLATSAKPNFTLTILPAMLFVYLFFYLSKTKDINWTMILIGMGAVSIAVLISQYLLTFVANGQEGITIAPFATILYYARNYFIGTQKIIMSVAFPLMVLIVYWKDVKGRFDFRLAWINYVVGILIAVLFAEPNHLDHANFFWGPMVGAFILFVITSIYYFTELFSHLKERVIKWKDFVPAVFLAIHLVYGIIYYLNALQAVRLVK